jgi:hypothetical protein
VETLLKQVVAAPQQILISETNRLHVLVLPPKQPAETAKSIIYMPIKYDQVINASAFSNWNPLIPCPHFSLILAFETPAYSEIFVDDN